MKRLVTVAVAFAVASSAAACDSFDAAPSAPDASAPTADGGGPSGNGDGASLPDAGEAVPPLGDPERIGSSAEHDVPVGLAIAGNRIFISNDRFILTRSVDVTTTDLGQPFLSGLDNASYLVTTPAHVFWTEFDGDLVRRSELDVADASVVGTIDNPVGIAFDTDKLWVTGYDTATLHSLPANGTNASAKLATASSSLTGKRPEGLALADSTLYIALYGANQVVSVDALNPTATKKVFDIGSPAGLAYDRKTGFLWMTTQNTNAGIFRWRPGMPAPERQAVPEGDTPTGIAVDDQYVYWLTRTSNGGSLWRAPK